MYSREDSIKPLKTICDLSVMATHSTLDPLANLYLRHLKLPLEKPSFQYLCQLQKKHIESIPHENIDGMYNFHSAFDIPHLLSKYILEHRGGLCFELNYSFAWLLNQLGFKVEIILSNVIAYEYHTENNEYPTHPIIIVHFNYANYLTDVGWSDSYRNPLSLAMDEYSDQTGKYRVTSTDYDKCIMQKWLECQDSSNQYAWHDQFIFNKPQGAPTQFSYPQGFLAAHAYTHVGKNYLLANTFEFTQPNPDGHCTIWDGTLFKRQGNEKKREPVEKKDVPVLLVEKFKVSPSVAKKCIPFYRSTSTPALYNTIGKKAAIKRRMTF